MSDLAEKITLAAVTLFRQAEAAEPDKIRLIYKIATLLLACSEDEMRVVHCILERVDRGRNQYGPLNLSTDTRDFRAERADEYADALYYQACELIAETVRGRRRKPAIGAEYRHAEGYHGKCEFPQSCACECDVCADAFTVWQIAEKHR